MQLRIATHRSHWRRRSKETNKPSNELVENAGSSEPSSAMWRAARKKNCEKTPQSCRGWWNMRGASCSRARRVETAGRHSKGCMARSRRNNWCLSERRCWRDRYPQKPLNRMSPRYKFGVWLGSEKQQCQMLRGDGCSCMQGARGRKDETEWE